MANDPAPEWRLQQAAASIADRLGLHFPRERWPDLRRGLKATAEDLGHPGEETCLERVLSGDDTPALWNALARHLTVGETYFLRDRSAYEALLQHLVPELIQSRLRGERRLRIWSAGCCTGEEPYSLAILLYQALPFLADWSVRIVATDINGEFLRRARTATYGEWSFRNTPAGFKENHFEARQDGRFRLHPEIARRVDFALHNLMDEPPEGAMDVIFCRNVLMYFTPEQARNAIGRLHRALARDGHLIVSPSEASQTLFAEFSVRHLQGATAYGKTGRTPASPAQVGDRPRQSAPSAQPPPSVVHPGVPSSAIFADAGPSRRTGESPPDFASLARASANARQLSEAIVLCDRWLVSDKLNPAAHYLRAVVLLERGSAEEAALSLQRAIYLDPGLVLAHFALGSLERTRGRPEAASRHFGNALRLLAARPPEEIVPESDGLTAASLSRTVAMLAGATS